MKENNIKESQVKLNGRDYLEIKVKNGKSHFSYIGCFEMHELLQSFRKKHGDNVYQWPMPEGLSHSELLLKELILKIKNQWAYPYTEDELCHCRIVKTEIVDQAILAGAHTPEAVSLWTSASTACGTCRPNVEKMIKYRLSGK